MFRRLREMYSTDILYGKMQSIDGIEKAQVFFGVDSGFTHVEKVRKKSDFGSCLLKFIRKHGAMNELRSDCAPEILSEKTKEILRWFAIKGSQSAPGEQQQNPVEGRIKDLLILLHWTMDRRNVPDKFWYQCLLWVVDMDNIIAKLYPNGTWMSRIERAFGVQPDSSALMMYVFFDKLYFYDADTPGSKEQPSRFMNWMTNTGDALCQRIWAEDTEEFVTRSVTRPRDDQDRNMRADLRGDGEDIDSNADRKDLVKSASSDAG